MQPTPLLATVTGRDRPGVTAALFAALAGHDVEIRDVEQVVVRDRLILAVLVDLRGEIAPLRISLTRVADAMGMQCELSVIDERGHRYADDDRPGATAAVLRSHVTVIGHPLRAGAVSHVAQRLADIGADLDAVTQLGSDPAGALEFVVRCNDPLRLRAVLLRAADEGGVDIAVEPAGFVRRAKRLVMLDVETALVRQDAVAELVTRAGVTERDSALTRRAKRGEIDPAALLRQRVALLAGMPVETVNRVGAALEMAPGTATFVKTLRRMGFRVGVVSGGFSPVTDRLVEELRLDFGAANSFEVAGGRLTGRLLGDVLDRRGKADVLRRFAASCGVPLSQTVAVGSGLDDVEMLDAAGLGVAFNASAALRAAGDPSNDLPFFDSLLFVLGIARADVAQAVATA
jgi:phosphoserine phosphatase